MSFKGFLFLCWGCFLLSFTGIYVANWKYVPKDAKVKFFVKEPNGEEAGVFTGLTGGAVFDPNQPEAAKITAEIEVKTINTGIEMRDESLRSKDFFEVAKYPKISFVSEKVEKTDSGYLATGKLTIKKTTREQKIPFRFMPGSENLRSVFSGGFTINRTDFGVGNKDDGVGAMVRVELEIPVVKE